MLASDFWPDLERHHPGIDSLRLSAETSTARKARLVSKTIRKRQPNGVVAEVTEPALFSYSYGQVAYSHR
ncbi:hypothetical protein [Streptomyces zagrosensis]|uniref:Uncharacterized protein n=1 Tax=Streptomyces zagrosensis TaxID=1042984 RepID=A0A7W9QEM9_9ACTN|nr:hypothetical protein [Streptomyces zagrosensis]MBB5938559.1 hypothetical protein [Streptomyces zagrosensis]